MLGFTGNLLGSIPTMGWERWRPGSRGSHGKEPKRGSMPFPWWGAQFTAVNMFLYKMGPFGAWQTPSSSTLPSPSPGCHGEGDRHTRVRNNHTWQKWGHFSPKVDSGSSHQHRFKVPVPPVVGIQHPALQPVLPGSRATEGWLGQWCKEQHLNARQARLKRKKIIRPFNVIADWQKVSPF